MEQLPAITGPQLIKLLLKDGWIKSRKTNHGQGLYKIIKDGKKRVTVISIQKSTIPKGTIGAILRQTNLTHKELAKLIEKHGIK